MTQIQHTSQMWEESLNTNYMNQKDRFNVNELKKKLFDCL